MAERYYFKSGDSIDLPVTGTFYTDEFPVERDGSMIIVALYDANGDVITPSAGTCKVEVSPIKGQWFNGTSSGDSTIVMAEAGASATYDIPVFIGPQTQARITLSDVSGIGASYIKAYLWRY